MQESSTQTLTYETIIERDIDLLLIEELSTDDDFCVWLTSELSLPAYTNGIGAWHSISDKGLGETDILFKYQSENLTIGVLIENKINASFQEAQFARYEERAKIIEVQTDCDKTFVILVAPEEYCINQYEFENFITYEKIAEKIAASKSKRGLFRSNLLKYACEKLSRGYQAVNSIQVQSFWKQYWAYKNQHYPSLIMKEPGIVPDNSDWPMLYDDNLKNITFYHKLAQGNVDANFRNFSSDLINHISNKLPPNMRIEMHNKSFSIRMHTGKIDRKKNFDEQIVPVKNGLEGLIFMRDWIKAELKVYL